MKPLHIEETPDSPGILLDMEKALFEINGQSLPEDVNRFFKPVLVWFRNYVESPLPLTELNIKLSYFNTATSKVLLDIFTLLEEMPGSREIVRINWHYSIYDEEMREAGQEYSEMVDLEFRYFPEKSE